MQFSSIPKLIKGHVSPPQDNEEYLCTMVCSLCGSWIENEWLCWCWSSHGHWFFLCSFCQGHVDLWVQSRSRQRQSGFSHYANVLQRFEKDSRRKEKHYQRPSIIKVLLRAYLDLKKDRLLKIVMQHWCAITLAFAPWRSVPFFSEEPAAFSLQFAVPADVTRLELSSILEEAESECMVCYGQKESMSNSEAHEDPASTGSSPQMQLLLTTSLPAT